MRVKKGYVLCESAGNNIVFREEDGVRTVGVLRLNDVGALLWRMLESGCDAVTLARRLCREYGIKPEQAKRDVIAYITSLVEANVLDE